MVQKLPFGKTIYTHISHCDLDSQHWALTVKQIFFLHLGDYSCFKEILLLTEISANHRTSHLIFMETFYIQLQRRSHCKSVYDSADEHSMVSPVFMILSCFFKYVNRIYIFQQVLQLCGSSPQTTGTNRLTKLENSLIPHTWQCRASKLYGLSCGISSWSFVWILSHMCCKCTVSPLSEISGDF